MKTASAVLGAGALEASSRPGVPAAEHRRVHPPPAQFDSGGLVHRGVAIKHGHGRVIASGCCVSGPQNWSAREGINPSGPVQSRISRSGVKWDQAQQPSFCFHPPGKLAGRGGHRKAPSPVRSQQGQALAAAALARPKPRQAREKIDVSVTRERGGEVVPRPLRHVGDCAAYLRRWRGLAMSPPRTGALGPAATARFRPPAPTGLDFSHSSGLPGR